VEILDGGSDLDICEETELTQFSRILHEAQKRALEEEKEKGNKRKTYNGRSRTTAYRRKRHQKDLHAQGYRPIDKYMEQKKNKDECTTPQILTLEDSEQSSDSDMALWSNGPSASECTDVEELVRSLAACGELRSPAAIYRHPDLASAGHCPVVQGISASEEPKLRLGHQDIQALREEEEESSGSEDEGNARRDRQGNTCKKGTYKRPMRMV
jgi:hypothetical protein